MSLGLTRKGPGWVVLVLAAVLLGPAPVLAFDTWTQSTPAGFGAGPATSESGRGVSFTDEKDGYSYAYFGTRNAAVGAGVWRSSDGVTWLQTNPDGFGGNANAAVVGLYVFNFQSFNTAMYAGVENAAGGQVWRSSGTFGSVWRQVLSSATTGGAQNAAVGAAGVFYKNALYLGTRNTATGGEVWKSTSADWAGAWIQTSTAGFGLGASATTVTHLSSHVLTLYAATGCPSAPCGQLWKSTGSVAGTDVDTWTPVLVASVTLDAGLNTSAIAALENFKGYLYLTTFRAAGGAQIWRTTTPDVPGSWTQVFSPDGDGATRFAGVNAQEVRALRAFKAAILYAGVMDPVSGLAVYRSTDGVTFTRSNAAAGFGDASNQVPGDFLFTSATRYPGGVVLANAVNAANGAAIWRAPVQPPEPTTLAVHVSSVVVTITAQGAGASGYIVEGSTNPSFSTMTVLYSAQAGVGGPFTISPQSLIGNTTYFLRAGTIWSDTTGYADLGVRTTRAATPTNLRASFTSTDTITWTWASANGPTPGHQVVVSTAADPLAPGGAAVTNALTYLTSFSTAGLRANTTYFFRVAAIDNAGVSSPYGSAGSTFTVPVAPGVPAEPFTAVVSSALTTNWTIGANDLAGPALFYDVQLSSGAFPNSFSGNVSFLTSSTGAVFGSGGAGSSLTGNATYYVQVRAVNSGGGGPFASLGSTLTLAAVPTTLTITGSFASSITFTWNSAGNGPGTRYSVLASTADPSSPAGAVVTASVTYNTSLSTAGLAGNTTYFFRVAGLNNNGDISAYSAVAMGFTLPAAPIAAASPFISAQVSSITVAWTPGDASGPPLRYTVAQSSGAFPNTFAANASSNTANLFAIFGTGGAGGALTPNTSYFYQVQAVNVAGGGAYLSIGSTSTLATLSSGLSIAGNSVSTIVFSWADAGNGPGASYTVLTSTAQNPSAPSGAVVTTSVTYNTTLSTAGLAADTTYFFQVSAANNNNVPTPFTAALSTFTLPAAPGAASPLFGAVAVSSLAVAWSSGANPAGGAPLNYVAELSTGTFPNAFAGNVRLNTASTGATFGAGGTGPDLAPATTYFLQVQAINAGGAGAFASLGSTATLAAVPVPLAFSAPTASAIQFNWSAGGNGAVSYTVLASTAPDPSAPAGAVVTTSATYNTFLSSAGLAANTTYWFRVSAINPNGVPSAYTAAAGTATLANAPAALALAAVDTSSVTLTWSAAGNPTGSIYRALASTHATPSSPGGAAVLSSQTVSTTITFPGLTSNATYFFQIAAVNQNNVITAFTAALGTGTLAAVPSTAAPTNVTNSSITANWGANGNAAATLFEAQASVDPAFGVVDSASATLSSSALLGGLAQGTTYYLRVRAVNVNGVPTAYAALPSTVTLNTPPAAPSLAGVALGASSIAWSWATVFNADGYRLASTASVSLSGNLTADATGFSETLLSTNTAYTRVLAGFNSSGASTSVAVTRFTKTSPPTGVAITSVFVTSITLQWTAGGNPAGTTFYALAWPSGGSTVTAAVQLTSAAITGLNDFTTYFLTVHAVNGDGLSTPSSVTLSTFTLVLPVSSATATPEAGATLVFSPPTGLVTVVVPPGAFSAPVGVAVTTTALVAAPVTGSGSTPTGVGVSITITTGQQPSRAIALTVGFRDSDVAGLDRDTLTLCRYDPTHNVWVPLFSTVDSANNTVTGLIDHLSIFAVFALTPAASVSAVTIFPNPFRPALGHNTVTFSNLPAGASLKVYTLLGQLLRTLTANGAGLATWDGTTDAGRAAATGLYVVHAKGGDSKVFRVGVQR